MHFIRPATNI